MPRLADIGRRAFLRPVRILPARAGPAHILQVHMLAVRAWPGLMRLAHT